VVRLTKAPQNLADTRIVVEKIELGSRGRIRRGRGHGVNLLSVRSADDVSKPRAARHRAIFAKENVTGE
jgi:hypothetical protein